MLCLSSEMINELIEHSREEAPCEACGILAGLKPAGGGERSEAKKIYRMTNTEESAVSFFMDPKEQLGAIKEMRASGLEMVGIYHSHPATAAYPSARDVEMAFYPDVSYLIISLAEEDKPVVKAFRIKNGSAEEEALETI